MNRPDDVTPFSHPTTISDPTEKESEKKEGVKVHDVGRRLSSRRSKEIKPEVRKTDDAKRRNLPGQLQATKSRPFSASFSSFSNVGQKVFGIVAPSSDKKEQANTVEFHRRSYHGEEEEEKSSETETEKEKEKISEGKTHRSRKKKKEIEKKGSDEAVFESKGFGSIDEIVNDWNSTDRATRKASFTRDAATQLHKVIRRMIKHGAALNLGEVMRIRVALQHKCQNPNVIKFYEKHPKFKKNLIKHQNNLFKLQEAKAPEIVNRKIFAGLRLETEDLSAEKFKEQLEEQEKIIEELFRDSSIETIEQFCDEKRVLLTEDVLSVPNKKYSLLVENIAIELNERTLEICKSIDFVGGKFVGRAELAQRRDSISNFVVNAILDIENDEKRAKMFLFFLDVAESLVDEKGDYHSSQGIVDALCGALLDRTLGENVANPLPFLKEHNKKRFRLDRLLGGSNFGVEELKMKMVEQKDLPTFVMSFVMIDKKLALANEKRKLAEEFKPADTEEEPEALPEDNPKGYSEEDQKQEIVEAMKIPLWIAERSKNRNPCLPGIYTDFISLETINVEKAQDRSDKLRNNFLKKYVKRGF